MMNTVALIMNIDLSLYYSDVPSFLEEGLFYKGNLSLLTSGKRVSIIGSRKPTNAGSKAAVRITKELIAKGFTTVSGMAEGIDTIVHKTTIDSGGKTIAVLGTPVEKVYPKSNTDIYNIMVENHLVLSQFDSGTKTRPSHFPMRNRTMAFISETTIICDATEKSGTKHQALAALKFKKQVFILSHIIDKHNVTWCKDLLTKGAKKLEIYQQEILSL